MSRDFPDWVDPGRAAAAGRRFAGSVPLDRMARLLDIIAEVGGQSGASPSVEFEIEFSHDAQGQVRVELGVRGRIPLICQRSLKRYDHALDLHSVIGIVGSERAAEALPGDYEPVVCADGRLGLVGLVEEEILLGLPLVPIDPGTEPVETASRQQDDGRRPFAALADWKSRRGEQEKN